MAHFLKSIVKNARGIPENTEKDLPAGPTNSWPQHGVRGFQGSQLIPVFAASTSICEFKFVRQMSSCANDQAKVLQFAAFRDHGWGHVALYPR